MEQLISLVHERPVLWDMSLEEYNRNINNDTWKDVCVRLYSEFDEPIFTKIIRIFSQILAISITIFVNVIFMILTTMMKWCPLTGGQKLRRIGYGGAPRAAV